MRISFELERQEYYPGEEIAAKIQITNPADVALEIPDPEDPAHVRIDGSRFQPIDKRLAARESYVDHFVRPFLGANPGVIWIGARQTREFRLNLSEPSCADRYLVGPRHSSCIFSFSEGSYQVYIWPVWRAPGFSYEVRYSVVSPSIYMLTRAMIDRFWSLPPEFAKSLPPRVMMTRVQMFVPVAVAERKGEHSILVRRSAGRSWRVGQSSEFGDVQNVLTPYFRTATLRERIVALTAVADEDETIDVTFSIENGATRRLRFDPNGKPIEDR